ncbi:MAG: hypothetical protein VYC39_18885 [Myxococcota bacterium]|nr:hypothetical protein [Myxococcota bacterium]
MSGLLGIDDVMQVLDPIAMRLAFVLLGFIIPTLFAVGCGDDPVPTVSASVSPSTFVSGSTLTLTVTTTDFDIRNPALAGHQHLRVASADDHDHDHGGNENLSNAGHYHVYLDSTDVNPLTQGYDSEIQFVVTTSPGPHKLIVRLNDDSHAFLKPDVTASVDITVE